MPTLEEWLPISVVTMGLNILIVSGIMDLRELATKEVYDWVASNPKIIDSCYLIVRLLDDIATFKWEQDRGINLSTVTCCMKDFGISEAEAIKHIQKMISSSWKDMNEELLRPKPVPMSVLKIVFSWPQLMEMYFAGGHDGYTNANGRTKDLIALMFVDPI
ncbi:Sesquiterpene synthase [Thalictrum thalictroides]|uniref:Sesquiterpene synthase n=1 Tax=Thalictrum thalictroides TaxID=46969 RepID=A0A7J6WST6_THATH|nr:Sesquiterpene synthase [Thalictrum thalictroides]